MRVINNLPWSPTEIESYRQIVYMNIVQGGRLLLDAAEEVDGDLSSDNEVNIFLVALPFHHFHPSHTATLPATNVIFFKKA